VKAAAFISVALLLFSGEVSNTYPQIMRINKNGSNAVHVIDVDDWRDMRNSSFSLHVTEDELKAAIKEVGPVFDDVQRHLKAYHSPLLHRPDRMGRRL
jgi:hypothetical protein